MSAIFQLKVQSAGRYRKCTIFTSHATQGALERPFFLLNKVMLEERSPKSPMNIFASVNFPLWTYCTQRTDWILLREEEGGGKREREKIPRQGALTKCKSYLKSENPGSRPNILWVMSSAALILFQERLGGGCDCLSRAAVQSHSLSLLSENCRLHLPPHQ